MRRLGLIDLLVVALIVALLVFAARQDFGRYTDRAYHPAPKAPAPTARH